MSELSVDLVWRRNNAQLTPDGYSNAHQITFNPRFSITGDAAPDWGGDRSNTNPEQALAAALGSCHMMTFLALAAKAGWPVAAYADHAEANLGKNNAGRMAVTSIHLHPTVEFDAGFEVSDDDLAKMHDRAHRYCFIAGSLSDEVEILIS